MHQVKIKNGPSSAKRAPAASKQLQLGAKKSARLDLSKKRGRLFPNATNLFQRKLQKSERACKLNPARGRNWRCFVVFCWHRFKANLPIRWQLPTALNQFAKIVPELFTDYEDTTKRTADWLVNHKLLQNKR